MGWWGTDNDDDVIGDTPVDIVTTMLQNLAISNEEQGKPKPTLPELLDGIALVLQRQPEEYLDNGKGISIQKIVAKGEAQSNQEEAQESNEKLLQILDEAFDEIVVVYEQTLDRKPRLKEMLACFAFVLADKPEQYLSNAKGASIEDIVAELA